MMQRPSNVPRAARYSVRDGWWQIGQVVDGRPFGPWRTWREDGSPLFEARFDSKGRLQGRFRRFHPDGAIAREARYERGLPAGEQVYHRAKGAPGDLFPSADPRASQVVIRYDDPGEEAERRLLDGRGHELAESGALDEGAGALDPVFAAAQPDGFLAGPALPRVLATLGRAPAEPADDFLWPADLPRRRPLDARRFQDLYGQPPATALRAWLTAMSGSPRLSELRITGDHDLDVAGNLIEALIREHQQRPGQALGLRALVAGVLPLAVDSAGVHHAVALAEADVAGSNAVYRLHGATDDLLPPVARTLDDFAFAIALASAADAGAVSQRGLERAFERLRGRIDLAGPLSRIEQRALSSDVRSADEIVGDPEQDHREGFYFRRPVLYPRYHFFRSRWLLRLVCGHAEGAAADFDPKFEGGLDDARFDALKQHLREPHVAFYWLLRCHVFGDPRLAALLQIAADAPSQLVRDTAALVRELAQGRGQLGTIADWPALVARFRGLDPMSNRGEGEDEDEDEDAGGAEATGAAEVDVADDPDDGDEAPGDVTTAIDLAQLQDDAIAGQVIAWALGEGYAREDLRIDDELDAAALGLARRADPRVVTRLAELHASQPWLAARLLSPWLDEDRADFAPLADTARAWLADRQPGSLFRWESGARLLARVGRESDAELIAAAVDAMLDASFSRGQGFEAAMASMELGRALPRVVDALISIGVPDSLVPALEGVVSAETHLVDEARGPCALALASLGRGLPAIVRGIESQLARDHGHHVTCGQLLAIGMLGRDEPADRRTRLVALLEALPELDHEPRLGQLCALRDLGQTIDLASALREALAAQRHGSDDTDRQRVALLAIVARRDDVPGELALPYVETDALDVHRAAVRALRMRGLPAPALVLYDPYHVAGLAARGREAIHEALADERGVYRGNLALWIAEHPERSSVMPLIGNARRIATRGGFPDEGPVHYELRWTVRALLAIADAAPGDGAEWGLVDELLAHADRGVAEPVLRYAERLPPAVARGMAHAYVHDDHWRRRTARSWLLRYATDPAVAAALAAHGLSVGALTGKEDEA
jgi:hypothetical protein